MFEKSKSAKLPAIAIRYNINSPGLSLVSMRIKWPSPIQVN